MFKKSQMYNKLISLSEMININQHKNLLFMSSTKNIFVTKHKKLINTVEQPLCTYRQGVTELLAHFFVFFS